MTGKAPPRAGPWTDTQLDKFIARATVDAFDEYEQRIAFFAMIEGNLGLPFKTQVLGVEVTVEELDQTPAGKIVAICRHGRSRHRIAILDLPLPSPPPTGAKWIEAYRRWCGTQADARAAV